MGSIAGKSDCDIFLAHNTTGVHLFFRHNLLNETSLREIFGISFEEAWGEIYLYMPRPRLLVKCWILRQFVDVLPALTAQVLYKV